MAIAVEAPELVELTREEFERAWLLGEGAASAAGVRPETAIVIGRNSSHDFQDRQIYLWVDGESLGKIRYGQSITQKIEPGSHTIRVFNTLLSQTLTVHAAPGEQVRVQCGNGMPTAGWLLMIFLHVTYLRVWVRRETA